MYNTESILEDFRLVALNMSIIQISHQDPFSLSKPVHHVKAGSLLRRFTLPSCTTTMWIMGVKRDYAV